MKQNEVIDIALQNLSGHHQLTEIIKKQFDISFKNVGPIKNKIIKLNNTQLILLIEYEDGSTEKAIHNRID